MSDCYKEIQSNLSGTINVFIVAFVCGLGMGIGAFTSMMFYEYLIK